MRKTLFLLALICVTKVLSAQQGPVIYTIRADSVKITNDCDTAELIIENHTQNVPGFLFNKGRGRTEFKRVAKLNDSSLIFGIDTLSLRGSISANNGLSMSGSQVQLGQTTSAAGNPAALLGNREIPSNGFRLNLSGNGSFVVGDTSSSNAKLQVNGASSENYFAAGPFLSNTIYATIHTIDTITSTNVSSTKLRAFQSQRRLRVQDDGLTLYDRRNTLIGQLIEAKNNVTLKSEHSIFLASLSTDLYLRQFGGFTGTTTFNAPATATHMSTATVSNVDLANTGATNKVVAKGFYGSYSATITTSLRDTIENYIGYSSGSNYNLGTVKNFYHHYMHTNPGIVNWGLYQEGNAVKNYLEGKTGIGTNAPLDKLHVQGTARITDTLKMPNVISKSDTATYKPVVVDANGNVFKMDSWNMPQITRTAISDAGYSALTTDYLIAYTSLTAPRTVTLPAASGMAKRIIIVKDESGAAATHNITINVTAGGSIDGTTSKTVITNYGTLEVYSNGSQWFSK